MVYPAAFHRIVLIGGLYSDNFNMTLAMVPTGGAALPAVTDTLLAAVGNFVGDWFNNPMTSGSETGIAITNQARLTSVKVNRIGTDGRYVDPETKEHVFTTPPTGSLSSTIPPQLTLAVTLRGANERQRAGRGRMYPPPSSASSSVNTDGRVGTSTALSHAKGMLFLLSGLNDVYLTAGVNAVAGIASHQGTGAFQAVSQVSVGRVVDTIRSRRNKLAEDPQFWGAP